MERILKSSRRNLPPRLSRRSVTAADSSPDGVAHRATRHQAVARSGSIALRPAAICRSKNNRLSRAASAMLTGTDLI